MPLPIAAYFIGAIGAAVGVLIFAFRIEVATRLVAKIDFTKFLMYRRILKIASGITLASFLVALVSFILLVTSFPNGVSRDSPLWFVEEFLFVTVLTSVTAWLIEWAAFLYIDILSSQGLANLCLRMALASTSSESAVGWLQRGIKAVVGRLQELHVSTSYNSIFFALNIRVLSKKPIRRIVTNLADSIFNLSSADDRYGAKLFGAIVKLTKEGKAAQESGLRMSPTIPERIGRSWNFLAGSSNLVSFFLVIVVVLLSYLLTGKLVLLGT